MDFNSISHTRNRVYVCAAPLPLHTHTPFTPPTPLLHPSPTPLFTHTKVGRAALKIMYDTILSGGTECASTGRMPAGEKERERGRDEGNEEGERGRGGGGNRNRYVYSGAWGLLLSVGVCCCESE